MANNNENSRLSHEKIETNNFLMIVLILLVLMVGGLVDADLGGDVLKKRVALPGRGKRGGARTLVATRRASRWFFVFGFEKNEKANVSRTELEALQWLAKQLLDLTGRQLEVAVQDGSLQEICHEH